MDVKKTIAALEKNGFAVRYFAAAAEAADAICSELQGKTIGFGGSVTLDQLGLYERLAANNTVYWHWRQPAAEAIRHSAAAQVYITSANAASEAGELVNIAGTGNRIAATLCGHERLYFVFGVNKIEKTLEDAVARARNVAAPLNARRLQRQTPCALAEPMRCHDCSSPQRICNGVAIHARPMGGIGRTEVIIIGEALGY